MNEPRRAPDDSDDDWLDVLSARWRWPVELLSWLQRRFAKRAEPQEPEKPPRMRGITVAIKYDPLPDSVDVRDLTDLFVPGVEIESFEIDATRDIEIVRLFVRVRSDMRPSLASAPRAKTGAA